MVRHRGSVVDLESRRVCDRDGNWYELDRLERRAAGLYYARAVAAPMTDARFDYFERWILPDPGWSIMRPRWVPGAVPVLDWYIEMEVIEVDGAQWTVRDGYLDLEVWEGQRCRLDDADELGDGLDAGDISVGEAAAVLRSLDRLCDELHANGNSGLALLAKFAAGLPR